MSSAKQFLRVKQPPIAILKKPAGIHVHESQAVSQLSTTSSVFAQLSLCGSWGTSRQLSVHTNVFLGQPEMTPSRMLPLTHNKIELSEREAGEWCAQEKPG